MVSGCYKILACGVGIMSDLDSVVPSVVDPVVVPSVVDPDPVSESDLPVYGTLISMLQYSEIIPYGDSQIRLSSRGRTARLDKNKLSFPLPKGIKFIPESV